VIKNYQPAVTSRRFHATVLATITYCSPSWSGLCSANDRARLDAFLRRSKRHGYCADDIPTTNELFAAADRCLFQRVLRNKLHVLRPLLPEKTNKADPRGARRGHGSLATWASAQNELKVAIFRPKILDPPLKTNNSYNLRPRQHDRQLTRKSVQINNC